MSSSWNVNNLPNGISQAEFEALLGQSVFNDAQQKQNVLSIFTRLAGEDAVLSAEEWSSFVEVADMNNDSSLHKLEASKVVGNSTYSLYKKSYLAVMAFFNIVKNYIERATQPEKTRQNGSSEVFYAQKNSHRAKSSTRGTFDGGWIEHDGHKPPSKTYDEWLKNNGYEFDWDVANELEKQAKRRDNLHGLCAAAFRYSASDTTAVSTSRFAMLQNEQTENSTEEQEDNFLNGELENNTLFNGMESQGSAYQYASELANNPYFKEIPHNIVATMDLKSLPKGCVIVYDANYKTSRAKNGSTNYHPHGHIAVTDGNGMDHGGGHYGIVDKKQATHIRVFVPIKIPGKDEIAEA